MTQRGSGLRNKYRNGRSTYSIKGKSRMADRYATMTNGIASGTDNIAGRSVVPIRK